MTFARPSAHPGLVEDTLLPGFDQLHQVQVRLDKTGCLKKRDQRSSDLKEHRVRFLFTVCVCPATSCRLFHSLLEDDALLLMACRGAPSSSPSIATTSPSSSSARIGLMGMAASFGGASPKSLRLCSSPMVWTKDRYL